MSLVELQHPPRRSDHDEAQTYGKTRKQASMLRSTADMQHRSIKRVTLDQRT